MAFKLFNFGGDDDYRDYDDDMDEGYDTSSSAVTEREAYSDDIGYAQKSKVISMSRGGKKLAVLVPTSYEEVMQEAVSYLKESAIVILNLERVNSDARMRIVDFMAGVVAAIEGKMKKTASCSYAIAPKNVDWINDLEDYGV
mgnify:FL=1